jgi:hypothetical protein
MAPPAIANQRRRRRPPRCRGDSVDGVGIGDRPLGGVLLGDRPSGRLMLGERPVVRLRDRCRSRARPLDRCRDWDAFRDWDGDPYDGIDGSQLSALGGLQFGEPRDDLHSFEACQLEDQAEAAPDVIGRERCALPAEEQEVLRLLPRDQRQEMTNDLGSERRKGHGPVRVSAVRTWGD